MTLKKANNMKQISSVACMSECSNRRCILFNGNSKMPEFTYLVSVEENPKEKSERGRDRQCGRVMAEPSKVHGNFDTKIITDMI